jgi:transcriptional regulator of acetoin/glycerol metabolism
MSEDATAGQLERRGINTSDDKLKRCPRAAYTEVREKPHAALFVDKTGRAVSVEAERHTHTEQQRYGIWSRTRPRFE